MPTNQLNSLDSDISVKRRRTLNLDSHSHTGTGRKSYHYSEHGSTRKPSKQDEDSLRRQLAEFRLCKQRSHLMLIHTLLETLSQMLCIFMMRKVLLTVTVVQKKKKIPQVKKNPIGIHERWTGDGHDKLKLYKIGLVHPLIFNSCQWL